MPALALVLIGWALAAVFLSALWGVQEVRHNAGLADVGWTFSLGALAVLYAALADGDPSRRALLAAVVVVWSLRLGLYVLFDRVAGKPEEPRYVELRARFGRHASLAFFVFFQIQALAAVALSLLFLVIASDNAPGLSVWQYFGTAVWAVAILGETAADRQLRRFRSDPATRGRTCRTGLWRYSRHPNYFFEWVHWWAYVLMAIGAPYWWLTLIGPAAMAYFLLRLTGIPVTERHALESRADYRDYRETTSAFVPWFPKHR
jgi:steroid 5-alpha reductase family enzyme